MEQNSISNWFESGKSVEQKDSILNKLGKKKHIIIISLFFIAIFSYLLHFFITNIPSVEGYIYEKNYDEEVIRYFLEERTRNGVKEYSVLQHIDCEDYTIRISRSSLNDPDKIVRFTVHLKENEFNNLKIGDYYKGGKFDYLTATKEKNNMSKTVYGWSTSKPEEEAFPGLK